MTDVQPQRHICVDCGVRLYTKSRAGKHELKTGHRSVVNWRAEQAVRKYRARMNPSYLDRLAARDEAGEVAWT